MCEQIKKELQEGSTVLGIELGSTRIKAVLIGSGHEPIAMGAHEWENRLENNVWTYSLEDIWTGLQDCYKNLAEDVKTRYDLPLSSIGAMGFSGMMHGYMAFDADGKLLVPFRTWQEAGSAL